MLAKSDIKSRFLQQGIDLTPTQVEQFVKYFELLITWNKLMNLTAITDPFEVLNKHFIDSVLSCEVYDFKKSETLIDIGTGAGFPGIPLKIVYPHLKVTLVDALKKRVQFLNNIIESLNLEDILAIHGRAEDLARTELRDAFDVSVSRAVSQLNVLCEYCLPFIKEGGTFISYKGSRTMEELKESHRAIELLGGKLDKVTDAIVLDEETQRGFVMIQKVNTTPEKYPRRSGKPLKKPL